MKSRSARKCEIITALMVVDKCSPRENLLIDKILELQDCLVELQDSYGELLSKYKMLRSSSKDVISDVNKVPSVDNSDDFYKICVQVPF